MIVSASRRTDIPAFYSTWFINRIRAGYCTIPNPFNRNQVTVVSLKPEDVDVIVFWTRNPRPLMPYLSELDQRGFRYYFQLTLLGNPAQIDPQSPPLDKALGTFNELADKVSPEKVMWRYDPIMFSNITDSTYHQRQYKRIAMALKGYTRRSIISIMDEYAKTSNRMHASASMGINILQPEMNDGWFCECITQLVSIAQSHNMEIFSCAEEFDLSTLGVKRGKCIDDDYIRNTFDIQLVTKKDPNQRKACGCALSKDIGMYNSCLYNCAYCYATQSFEKAKRNFERHDPESPSLVGWYERQQR